MNKLSIVGREDEIRKVFDLIRFDEPNEKGEYGNFDFRKLISIYNGVKEEIDNNDYDSDLPLKEDNFSDFTYEEKIELGSNKNKEVKYWIWNNGKSTVFNNYNETDKMDTDDTIYFRTDGRELPEILIKILSAEYPELRFICKYNHGIISEYVILEKGIKTEGDFWVYDEANLIRQEGVTDEEFEKYMKSIECNHEMVRKIANDVWKDIEINKNPEGLVEINNDDDLPF